MTTAPNLTNPSLTAAICTLEHKAWSALCKSASELLPLLADNPVMIFPGNLLLTATSTPSVRDILSSPEYKPWVSYTLSHDEVLPLGTDSAVIYYRVEATRADETFRAICSSAWTLDSTDKHSITGGWKMPNSVKHQHFRDADVAQHILPAIIFLQKILPSGSMVLVSSLARSAHRPLCYRMTQGISYAAAVSTPNGNERQPQIQARACSDPDMRSSYESQNRPSQEKKPRQRPGAGIRAQTSFRSWAQKGKETVGSNAQVSQDSSKSNHHPGPREEHRPNTANPDGQVYVLTLKLEDTLSQPMDSMRKQYFPKRLNRTPAHLTFFHALPHSHLEELDNSLASLAAETKDFQVATGGPFRMKKGVGVNIDTGYQQIKNVHAQLKSQWSEFLSEQDAGGFRPHWTVMNKVDEEEKVDSAFHAIRKELASNAHEGQAIGLDLWLYERGNWIFYRQYTFGQAQLQSTRSDNDRGNDTSPASNKRPGMKRGNSMAEAWRSMSFRRKS